MGTLDLPAEIWSQVFDLAADEDLIFQQGLPTAMAESAWYKDIIIKEWRLRSPQEAMNLLQRRSYATKKAIILTCKRWKDLGSEFLFRCLYFSDPVKLITFRSILHSSSSSATTITSSHGWWTRRLHVSRYHPSPSRGATQQDIDNALISIIQHCPNLEIFIVDRPIGLVFGPVMDTLATCACRSLQTIHWNIPGESLSKVIWALNLLPYVVAAHIDFESPTPSSQECAHLGSATDLLLDLPYLQQLSLRGYVEEFVEQAMGWHLPSLRSFSVDSSTSVNDAPDIAGFVAEHGVNLILLDLDCTTLLDLPVILQFCPNLQTFAFNADVASTIINRPHPHIRTVGLHGLGHAFGVGYAAYATVDPIKARIIRRSNDFNVSSLTKAKFPRLGTVRALSRYMLSDLNRADGPSVEDGGYERWNRWWEACTAMGVRLEDCTGQLLGTLPQDDEEDEADESDYEEEEEGRESGSGSDRDEEGDESDDSEYEKEWESRVPSLPAGNGRTMELTRLLQEVRAMNEGRDEALIARIRIERPPSPEE